MGELLEKQNLIGTFIDRSKPKHRHGAGPGDLSDCEANEKGDNKNK